MKKYRYLIIPIVAIILFSFSFNMIINKKVKMMLEKKDLTSIKHTYNHLIKDKGGALKNAMHDENDLMLLGSSELSAPVSQNPITFFPFKGAEYDVSIYGRAYTQSLQHSTIISNTKNITGKDKIAIIISSQWFERGDGIDGSNFVINFSELQFYQFFKNKHISKENKIYYAKRMSELLKQSGEYNEESIYSSLYYKDNFITKSLLTILKPYYNLKTYMLGIRDKVQTINEIQNLEDKKDIELRNMDWEEEYEKANEEGSSKVTNNDINVDDEYYDTYLRDKYDTLEGKWGDRDLLESKELEDYKFLLKVSNELEIKPLIILMPVNALYYDHIGWTVEKRTEFYDAIESMAEESGFDVLNLQSKEYEKYYMYDVMHLGWKGWLNIDEEMYKYFNER